MFSTLVYEIAAFHVGSSHESMYRVVMKEKRRVKRRPDDDASMTQRKASRLLSIEDRFRQNDSMSRFRLEALRSRERRS